MSDYFEIDFLNVEAKSSGDAICVRYELGGETFVHVVDGGYQSTGDSVANHIKKYYDVSYLDHVVATHNDGDHAVGLQKVLEEFEVGALWMLRPWHYADELLPRFKNYQNVDNLRAALKKAYPNLAELEKIAHRKGIPINEPFQGASIEAFTVMAPTKTRFLDLVLASNKTPEARSETTILGRAFDAATMMIKEVAALVKAAWGDEYFPAGETSEENEMSVVQYALLNGEKILLTGDTGRAGLQEVIDYAPFVGLALPGVDRFQVPHHGGRHNVNSELLDQLLGPKLESQSSSTKFTAVVSCSEEDANHPRKSVVRAMHHRGAKVLTTEGVSIRTYSGDVPDRGWGPATPVPYPDEQED